MCYFGFIDDIEMLDKVLRVHDTAERKAIADKKCGEESKHTCSKEDDGNCKYTLNVVTST